MVDASSVLETPSTRTVTVFPDLAAAAAAVRRSASAAAQSRAWIRYFMECLPLSTRAFGLGGRRLVSWLTGLPAAPSRGLDVAQWHRCGRHPRSQWRVRAGLSPASHDHRPWDSSMLPPRGAAKMRCGGCRVSASQCWDGEEVGLGARAGVDRWTAARVWLGARAGVDRAAFITRHSRPPQSPMTPKRRLASSPRHSSQKRARVSCYERHPPPPTRTPPARAVPCRRSTRARTLRDTHRDLVFSPNRELGQSFGSKNRYVRVFARRSGFSARFGLVTRTE